MKENLSPTQDEKVTSALAHAAVILPMWGIIITAVFWATQREKSKFIQDQTLQALSWQILQVSVLPFASFRDTALPIQLLVDGFEATWRKMNELTKAI